MEKLTIEEGSVRGLFDKYDSKRSVHLARARKCAELTLPAILPPSGYKDNAPLSTPYQGLGAMCVNNLASKLLLTLLPPNSPFFRIDAEDSVVEELAAISQTDDALVQIQKSLGKLERKIVSYVETRGFRVPVFRLCRHLIITGDGLCYFPQDKTETMRVYRLDQYVVRRDPSGNPTEIITKESISPKALTPELLALLDNSEDALKDDDQDYDLFTYVKRSPENWEAVQELNGKFVPGSEGTYKLDECPFLPLRWSAADGEDYGRGHVEEYLGDFISLEGLTQAIVEGSAACSKLVFLVNPNGNTDVRDLVNAPNGGFVSGRPDDVMPMQVEKFHDFRITFDTSAKLEERLARAFLLNSSIQRNAERVTAEEIRYMAGELEDALGGIYSNLSNEFQRPFLKLVMLQMQAAKQFPKLPDSSVKFSITTGIEALGRGHDLNKLEMFIAHLTQLGPEIMAQHLNPSNLIARIATSLGIDTEGLIKSDEQIAQEQQQAQMMQMQNQVGPTAIQEIVKGGMGMLQDQNKAKMDGGQGGGGGGQVPPPTEVPVDAGPPVV